MRVSILAALLPRISPERNAVALLARDRAECAARWQVRADIFDDLFQRALRVVAVPNGESARQPGGLVELTQNSYAKAVKCRHQRHAATLGNEVTYLFAAFRPLLYW